MKTLGVEDWTLSQVICCFYGKGKDRASPEESRRLGFPDVKESAHEGVKVVSPKHRPFLPHRKYSW